MRFGTELVLASKAIFQKLQLKGVWIFMEGERCLRGRAWLLEKPMLLPLTVGALRLLLSQECGPELPWPVPENSQLLCH